mmetsp:Transcript_4711/g.5045  ORF Transcript_4711/g.5045 Transcript_4711/m.5045 type:complete len:245 (-) Transcript_4711:114-848(-)
MILQTLLLRFWVTFFASIGMQIISSRPVVVMAWATARRLNHHIFARRSGVSNIFHDSTTLRYFSTPKGKGDYDDIPATFKPGDNIQVEVIQFGPLGASVEVIGLGHGDDVPLLPPDAPEPYGLGLIIQQEIKYFRESRNFVDVVRGEVLPAFVQNVREEDGKLDITLRSYGGKAKSTEVGAVILDRLKEMPDGRLNIGEKSSPAEINQEFPGVSKSVFKKALGGLYKKGLVKPGPKATELMSKS